MSEKIDLTPATLDLAFYAGDIGDFQISFIDDSGNPIDVSAWTWASQIRATRTSSEFTVLTVDVTEASTGILTIEIPDTVTRTIADNPWNKTSQWDLQSTLDGTDVVTILQGSVYCGMDVTR